MKTMDAGHSGEDSDILTRTSAARVFGVDPRTIDYWRFKKGLPWHRLGHRVLFTRKELVRFVETQTINGPGDNSGQLA